MSNDEHEPQAPMSDLSNTSIRSEGNKVEADTPEASDPSEPHQQQQQQQEQEDNATSSYPPTSGGTYVPRDAQSVMLDTRKDPLTGSGSLAPPFEVQASSSSSGTLTNAQDPSPPSSPVQGANDSRASSKRSSVLQPQLAGLTAPDIYGVVLVDFDHALGPKVEWSSPSTLKEDHKSLIDELPFLALPDGAHSREEDYSYFHMYCPSLASGTIFGISCNRQIAADKLLHKSSGVTRSTVQKAIVVLASKPVFGPIRDKLGVITKAFFEQMDFQDTSILDDFHSSLQAQLTNPEVVEESVMNMGTSLRELVYTFRLKVLQLFKVLMLQRRVMFYGSNVESLCTFQYSLISLIPCLLLHLEDAASPELNSRAQNMQRVNELKSSDKRSVLRYLGLPLNIFGAGALFQPYLPLQQIDHLQAQSYLVGTTNSIFQQQKDAKIDVLVNIDTATIDFLDPSLIPMVSLTAEDRAWMDEIVRTVTDTWNAADPSRPLDMKFVGSDDYLRSKFEEYICSVLSAIKFVAYLSDGKAGQVLISSSDLATGLSTFNQAWVKGFQRTPAFAYWDTYVDQVIFDLVEPKHPAHGSASVLSDVGLRLAQGVHDLKLDETLGPARDFVGKGIQSGTQSMWGMFSAVRSDISKRQSQIMASPAAENLSKRASQGSMFSDQAPDGTKTQGTPAQYNVGGFASSVGSFLSNKRTQFFSAPSTPAASTSMAPPQEVSTPGITTTPASGPNAGAATPDQFGPSQTTTPATASSAGGSFLNRLWSSPAPATAPSAPASSSSSSNRNSAPLSTSQGPSAASTFFRRMSGGDMVTQKQQPQQSGLKELSLAPKSTTTGAPSQPRRISSHNSPRLSPSNLSASPDTKSLGGNSRRTSTASTSSQGSRLSSHKESDDYVTL